MWNVLIVLALAIMLMFALDVVVGRSLGESWFTRASARSATPLRKKLSALEFFTGPTAVLMVSIGLPLSLTHYFGVALFVAGAGLLGFGLGMAYARRKDNASSQGPQNDGNRSSANGF